jgi:DNA-binding CsgD family transcriptional regulator
MSGLSEMLAGDGPYTGPDRRRRGQELPKLMVAVLDEVDHGLLVITDERWVLQANHAAHVALNTEGHPLRLSGQRLLAVDLADMAKLDDAIGMSRDRGLRSLLTLGEHGEVREDVSVVPLGTVAAAAHARPTLLVKLGRRQMVQALSVVAFASAHGLSAREQEVLGWLCQGLRPADIAAKLGVSLPTVRTHIHHARRKAGAADVMALIKMVATLPPMVSALKGGR